jgi:hypothetical protein
MIPGELESLLEQALTGDKEAIYQFYKRFLTSEFIVPERFQEAPLSNSAKYPNDFFNLLGIQNKEKSIIPIFCNAEQIQDWCALNLNSKKITAEYLLNNTPEDWWLHLNPGAELNKEFSPWEIKKLLEGELGLNEIISDFGAYEDDSAPLLSNLKEDEYINLKNNLLSLASIESSISKITIAKATSQENKEEKILLAIFPTEEKDHKISKELKDKFLDILRAALIGDLPYECLIINKEDNLNRLLFANFAPLFQREDTKSSLLTKIIKTFKRGL